MTHKKYLLVILAVIIVAVGAWAIAAGFRTSPGISTSPTPTSTPSSSLNTVVFSCDANKSIKATFDTANDVQVQLILSDGRSLAVPHAVSANGARYANADESFVFWNVGTTAFIQENGTTTFANCLVAPADTSSVLTYRNDTYGFELAYPQGLSPEEGSFKAFHVLSASWRYGAGDDKGNAVVAIPVFRVDQGGVATGKPYPLYFDAEVRVGVSADAQAVADCYKTDPGYTNQPHRTVTVNGVQFQQFDFQDAATMQYVQGTSYRVVHNNMCFAIEQVRTGSSYRDDSMTAGTSDAQLDAYYAQAGDIAQSFRFTK